MLTSECATPFSPFLLPSQDMHCFLRISLLSLSFLFPKFPFTESHLGEQGRVLHREPHLPPPVPLAIEGHPGHPSAQAVSSSARGRGLGPRITCEHRPVHTGDTRARVFDPAQLGNAEQS